MLYFDKPRAVIRYFSSRSVGACGSLFRHEPPTPNSPHANEPLWTTPIPCRRRKIALLPLFLSGGPSFLGFLPFFFDFFEIQGHEEVIYGFLATVYSGVVFFFMDKLSSSLQDPIFLVFFELSEACSS